MTTTVESINKIITALFELEAKGCHLVFFEYGNELLRVRICKRETEKIMYEQTTHLTKEPKALEKLLELIDDMKCHILKTIFQCYRQEFIKGVKSGKWEKTKPIIEFGNNATSEMLIDFLGYYINDPDNNLLYFVDMKQLSETNE